MAGTTEEWSLASVPNGCLEFEPFPLNSQLLILLVIQP